tara:strand:+ start:13381 stop:13680 length:300 start_codon:yes stop_codon:yes gene_type:complete
MKKEIFDNYANAVADKFHLNLGDMFTNSRKREIVEARQMLYFLCRERPIRLNYIQRFMEENGLPISHSTILHGIRRAKEFVSNDDDYKNIIDIIKKDNQ